MKSVLIECSIVPMATTNPYCDTRADPTNLPRLLGIEEEKLRVKQPL